MKPLVFAISIIFLPNMVFALNYQEIISQDYPNLILVGKKEFDEKTFKEQLSPDQLKYLAGVYNVAEEDFDSNGLKDFVALTHEIEVKREKVGPYNLPQLWMVICLQNTDFTCHKIRKYLLGEPIQSYLSAGKLSREYECNGIFYQRGTPAFFVEPALGNISEWSVLNGGRVVSCHEGD